MNEEALKLYAELTQEVSLCQDEDIKTLGKGILELANNYDKSLKEIERLNNKIEKLERENENRISESLAYDLAEARVKELENIIKEVREYIEEKYDYVLGDDTFLDHDELVDRKQINHILEILDKEKSNENI